MSEQIPERDAQMAAELTADVGADRIGEIYAEAFLACAEKARATESLLAMLDSLVHDVLDAFPDLERVLVSRLVSYEEKTELLDRVFGPRVSPVFLNFLKVVCRHGRLDCLRAINRKAHELLDRMRGRIQVRLTTATPVDDAAAARICDRLAAVVGGEPVLTRVVDPNVIGGVIVRIGDTVHDGSVANQLKVLRQQMIDRSVHEIQSRRNRFRDPAGD